MPIVGSFAGASARAYGASAGIQIGDFESIQTITVGTAVPSVSFTSIPQTYTHLQLRMSVRATNTTDATGTFLQFQFNSDTASNYFYHNLKGNGAAVEVGGQSGNVMYMERIAGNNQTANVFSPGVVDFLDYANTNKFKTTRSLLGFDANGQGQIAFDSGLWRSTSGITSISITPQLNFAVNSTFALYGVKA
jgi:hypothetical protein